MTWLHRQITILDTAVKTTGFLVADRFTFADINLMPILHRLAQAPEGNDALAQAVHLSKYYEQHKQRSSFQRTSPPPEGHAKPHEVRRSPELAFTGRASSRRSEPALGHVLKETAQERPDRLRRSQIRTLLNKTRPNSPASNSQLP